MTQINRTDLVDLLYAADIDPDEQARWTYSGRNMYGATCFGFTGNEETFAQFIYQAGYVDAQRNEDDEPPLFDELGREVRTDSMGYSTIYYFPGVEIVDDREPSDVEEDEDASDDVEA